MISLEQLLTMLVCTFVFEINIFCRSRDPKVLDECDVVVDVGGVYDPEKMRFDHHQRSVHVCLTAGGWLKPKLGSGVKNKS